MVTSIFNVFNIIFNVLFLIKFENITLSFCMFLNVGDIKALGSVRSTQWGVGREFFLDMGRKLELTDR